MSYSSYDTITAKTAVSCRGSSPPHCGPLDHVLTTDRTYAGGQALIPEAKRSVSLVLILNVCSWLLLATGMFQVVVSKMSDFEWVSQKD